MQFISVLSPIARRARKSRYVAKYFKNYLEVNNLANAEILE